MGVFLRLLVALALVLRVAGCETTKKAGTAVESAATVSWTGTKRATAKFSKYLKNADFWKKNHDSNVPQDDLAIKHQLRKAGVARSKMQPNGTPTVGRPTFPVAHYKGEFGWPLEAGIVSSEYGERWGRLHKGIDVAAEMGEPVYASADGVVIYSGDGMHGYGNVIILRHDEVTTTLYAHNKALKAKEGDHVKAGETIALLGSTGDSTGPHCHFEYREGDSAINPREKLLKTKF
ncbi:MAG: M23 family metallopeptidase [Thermoanaerobaculia bacterium]